jgi:two-component system sensor histidine kinase DesK
MAVASVALPLTRPAPGRHLVVWRRPGGRSSVVVTLSELERSGRLMHLAVPAAVAYGTVFPIVQVGIVAESWGGGYGKGAWALAATVGFLPLHLGHVAHAVRGTRPPAGVWTLAAMTAIILGALPLTGSLWLPTCYAIIVSALIVLRPPWSLAAAAAVVVAQVPLAHALDTLVPAAPSYYALTVVWRASSVFVPIWLVGAIRQLHAARRALADEAVVRERVRIDAELRETLGTALDAIVSRGQRAGELLAPDDADALHGADRAALEHELRELVDGSRRALADARQLVTGYQRGSLRAEVDSAVSLLTAAGLPTRVELPAGRLPDTVDATVRAALRADTARLLRDDAARGHAVVVTYRDGAVRLALAPGALT